VWIKADVRRASSGSWKERTPEARGDLEVLIGGGQNTKRLLESEGRGRKLTRLRPLRTRQLLRFHLAPDTQPRFNRLQ